MVNYFRGRVYSTLSCLIVGGSNKMPQGEKYQDFLKRGGIFLGQSLIMIKQNFSQNLQFDLLT